MTPGSGGGIGQEAISGKIPKEELGKMSSQEISKCWDRCFYVKV